MEFYHHQKWCSYSSTVCLYATHFVTCWGHTCFMLFSFLGRTLSLNLVLGSSLCISMHLMRFPNYLAIWKNFLPNSSCHQIFALSLSVRLHTDYSRLRLHCYVFQPFFFSFSTVPWLLTLVPNLMHTSATCQHFNQLFSV